MNDIVTRIAPSPTGDFLHLGNLRTMLYNYFLAKRNGGKFYVRLEDTDRNRYNEKFLNHFKDTCDWLGIVPDASYWNPDKQIGSFIQSERDYSDYVKILLDKGLAYYAFDSNEELDDLRAKGLKYDSTTRMTMKNSYTLSKSSVRDRIDKGDKYVIRFSVTANREITFTDQILGDITINTNTLDDKVLVKSNGIGSYHLCNVCDDHNMGITHVLRGNEWVNSTPLHILIYEALGWKVPIFAHLPLILNPNGKGKLSKRSADKYGFPISPIGYIDQNGNYKNGWKDLGYDPEALMNTISLLGWNPGNDVEIMKLSEMIDSFSLERVQKSGARFDMDKAKWINSQHLKMTENSQLLEYVDIKDDRYSQSELYQIIDLAKNRSDFKYEMNDIVKLFFDKPLFKSSDKSISIDFISVFSKFLDRISNLDLKDKDIVKDTIYKLCKDSGTKMGKVMPGLRTVLVGGVAGPDLLTTMSILGEKEVSERLELAISNLV